MLLLIQENDKDNVGVWQLDDSFASFTLLVKYLNIEIRCFLVRHPCWFNTPLLSTRRALDTSILNLEPAPAPTLATLSPNLANLETLIPSI